MVHCLSYPEGIQRKEEISVAMATSILEEMTTNFFPCRKSWEEVVHGQSREGGEVLDVL